MEEKKLKHVAILGSTGSIGTQALEVIRANPQHFVVEVLVANSNSELLMILTTSLVTIVELEIRGTSITKQFLESVEMVTFGKTEK